MAQFFEYDGRYEGYHFDLLGSSMHVSKTRLYQPMENAFDNVWLLPSGQSFFNPLKSLVVRANESYRDSFKVNTTEFRRRSVFFLVL